jgi:hypothetical protein
MLGVAPGICVLQPKAGLLASSFPKQCHPRDHRRSTLMLRHFAQAKSAMIVVDGAGATTSSDGSDAFSNKLFFCLNPSSGKTSIITTAEPRFQHLMSAEKNGAFVIVERVRSGAPSP